MKCKICQSESSQLFKARILNKYDADYYQCPSCHFIQTEEPYWLQEAYEQSINTSDTGYIARNLFLSKKVTILLFLMFGKQGNFLDYAGGYGSFVRIMRDNGFNFFWEDKYTQNLFAQGFEWRGESLQAITAFEVFEHFVEPMAEIEKLFVMVDTVILSTELYPKSNPKPSEWWYFGLEHGQHISFYSIETFEFVAKKLGLNYYNVGSIHILSKRIVPRWKIRILKLSKLQLDLIIKKLFLHSKTFSDYQFIVNGLKQGEKNENSL